MDTRRNRFLLAVVVTGGVAFLLNLAPILAFGAFGSLLDWLSRTRHTLIAWGVPTWFVAGYVAFAGLELPTWVLLACITFGIGISSVAWGKRFAMMLALWVPVSGFITDSFIYTYWLWSGECGFVHSYQDVLRYLFSYHVRVVSLFAVVVGISAWYLGWLLGSLWRGGTPENSTHLEEHA